MAKADDCSIHISEAMRGDSLGTIQLRGLRQYRLRLKIASWLVILAAWVCGSSITAEMVEE